MPQRPDFRREVFQAKLLAVGIHQRKEAGSVRAPVDLSFQFSVTAVCEGDQEVIGK